MEVPWLNGLNPAQRDAVTAEDGPLLVVAGAGTGKTKTLAGRVAFLLDRGVPADAILLLTFTRRAAAEMLHRAGLLVGHEAAQSVWGGTFHAVAHRLLRMYGRIVSLPDNFTVMDQSDAADLMNLIRAELGVAKRDRRFPRKATLVAIYSRMVNAQETLVDTLETHFPWCRDDEQAIKDIFERYARRKREQHLVDFDDLLLFWSALCAARESQAAVADRFEHVLVDEYQDTNAVQAEILRGMRSRVKNLMVVGDDAQSIYSFRAATVRNILDFPKQFPGTRVITLEQNYRSTQPILAASNAVMEEARQRYTKNLRSDRRSDIKPRLITCLDESRQTDLVCRHVLDHLEKEVSLMAQAVLFRAGHHSAMLEIELRKRNIPFRKYGGLRFVETAHVKDMIALLRILENPFDQLSWFRVLQMIEGIGPKTARRIMSGLGIPGDATGESSTPPVTTASPVARLASNPPPVPPAARKVFDELRHALADCEGFAIAKNGNGSAATSAEKNRAATVREREESGESGGGSRRSKTRSPSSRPPLTAQIERIRRFYEPIFKRLYENATVRLRDLDQLGQIAAAYRSRNRFITDLTLDPPEVASDLAGEPFLEEDYLTLSTIHSAKGCEWTVVHIIHAADGMIPSDMATGNDDDIEEERRLFYVAMTRAKDMLYVYFPLRYYHRRFGHGDAHNYAQLTRFVPESARSLFDTRPAEEETGDDVTGGVDAAFDPYARVSRLWRG